IRRYSYYERPLHWQPPWDPWNERRMSLDDTVSEKDKIDVDRHDPYAHLKTAPLDEELKKVVASPAKTIGDLYDIIKRGFFDVTGVVIGDPEAQVEPFYID